MFLLNTHSAMFMMPKKRLQYAKNYQLSAGVSGQAQSPPEAFNMPEINFLLQVRVGRQLPWERGASFCIKEEEVLRFGN